MQCSFADREGYRYLYQYITVTNWARILRLLPCDMFFADMYGPCVDKEGWIYLYTPSIYFMFNGHIIHAQ